MSAPLTHVEHPFGPLFSPESRILILGSFPSVKSRAANFFYGHPQNRFWPMLAAVFGAPVPVTVAEKTALALTHDLALWDVIAACDIAGSSDASVRNAVPTEITRITDRAPIRRVLTNGALSTKLYRQYLEPVTGIPPTPMPSTSPANAACTWDRLLEAWKKGLLDADP